MTANMIAWAKNKLGIHEYAGWCLDFIEDALEQSNDIELFGGVPLERVLAQKPD